MTEALSRAAELQRDFDRSFAEPAGIAMAGKDDLLAIQAGAQPYAIQLSEIAGLFAGKKTTRVPGASAALRGIAGFRGALLPVYDLPLLLGHSIKETPRWLMVAAAAPVALAFETFIGQMRVTRDEILPQANRADASEHARDVVRTADFVGPILHLASILDALRRSENKAALSEEQ